MEYLKVQLPDGQSIDGGTQGEFTVSSFELGAAERSAGVTIFQPFAVTLNSTGTPGINALLAAASAGTQPLTLTFEVTNSEGVVTERISVTGASIVDAQTTSGGSAFAFDYSSLTVTPYTQNPDGSSEPGTSVTTTVPESASFAPPTPATLPLTPTDTQELLLSASDDPGSTRGPDSTSDFLINNYQFAVGSNGQAGPLVIDFGPASDSAKGVSSLYSDLLSNHVIPSLTLYVETKVGPGTATSDQVTFKNAVVSDYVDSNGDVTVTFDFESATLKSAY